MIDQIVQYLTLYQKNEKPYARAAGTFHGRVAHSRKVRNRRDFHPARKR